MLAAQMTFPPAVSQKYATAAMLVLLAAPWNSACCVHAQDSGLEVHAPWALTKQIDPKTKELQFVAMTPALDDHDTWLLLACTPARSEIQVYLVAASPFSYPLADPVKLELHLDGLPAIPSTADTADGKLVRFRTPAPRDLALQIDRGSRMTVSIQQLEGQSHDYKFRLQPTEFALRGIRAHCLADGR